MLKVRRYLWPAALLLLLAAQPASADLLFTNFEGDPFGGNLWTSGGDCSGSCYALEDNFSNGATWDVSGFTLYLVSALQASQLESGSRFALFTAAGAQVVAPTDTAATVTDTGLTFDNGNYKIFKLEITGLTLNLPADEYQFRFTNSNQQSIYPGYGNVSAQTIAPGFVQLSGSIGGDSLLATTRYQRDENWAFQVIGAIDTVFADSFEAPDGP